MYDRLSKVILDKNDRLLSVYIVRRHLMFYFSQCTLYVACNVLLLPVYIVRRHVMVYFSQCTLYVDM